MSGNGPVAVEKPLKMLPTSGGGQRPSDRARFIFPTGSCSARLIAGNVVT